MPDQNGPATDEKKPKLDAQIKSVDMSEDMQAEAVEVAQEAMAKFNIEKVRLHPASSIQQALEALTLLIYIGHSTIYQERSLPTIALTSGTNHSQSSQPPQFDLRKGATWHCIVGRNFGSFVTHETKHFIYFYLGHCAILLFKTQ
ncbi:MAG: Dynein light chain [Cirrosporium novae-zelandiae]|nr:MAG: Dynein light chain [Cirrosporium novae-zelandiae]